MNLISRLHQVTDGEECPDPHCLSHKCLLERARRELLVARELLRVMQPIARPDGRVWADIEEWLKRNG